MTSDGRHTYSAVWLTAVSRRQLVVSVRSCANALVALSATAFSASGGPTVEIELANGRSTMRDAIFGNVTATAVTPDLLRCDATRTFWVRWSGAGVDVGRGPSVGRDVVMATAAAVAGGGGVAAVALDSRGDVAAHWTVDTTSGQSRSSGQRRPSKAI